MLVLHFTFTRSDIKNKKCNSVSETPLFRRMQTFEGPWKTIDSFKGTAKENIFLWRSFEGSLKEYLVFEGPLKECMDLEGTFKESIFCKDLGRSFEGIYFCKSRVKNPSARMHATQNLHALSTRDFISSTFRSWCLKFRAQTSVNLHLIEETRQNQHIPQISAKLNKNCLKNQKIL